MHLCHLHCRVVSITGCIFIRYNHVQVVRSLITKKHGQTAITRVDSPWGLHGPRGSVPVLGISRQIKDKEPLWGSNAPHLCPGNISALGILVGTTQGYFIQSALKDYGSEGSNPTFFLWRCMWLQNLYTSQGLFLPVWDLNPDWYRRAEARGGRRTRMGEREEQFSSGGCAGPDKLWHSHRGSRNPGSRAFWLPVITLSICFP